MKKYLLTLGVVVGVLSPLMTVHAATLYTYNSVTAQSTGLASAGDENGQSWTTPNDGVSYTLTSAKFYLQNVGGTAVCLLAANLYEISGAYGSSDIPSGGSLATSGTVSCTSLTSGFSQITFNFTTPYVMSPNHHYFMIVTANSIVGTVNVARDHAGVLDGSMAYCSGGCSNYAGYNVGLEITGTPPGGGGGGASTSTTLVGNTYIFLITSILVFLAQLFAILCIFFIAVVLVGQPIKLLMRRMRMLINRAGR